MGAWGSGLYANDTSCDVRDTYMENLMNGLSDEEAYEKTMEKVWDYLEDLNEAPLAWFALAETQWKLGRLMPEVREKALYWIDHEGGLEPWLETVEKGRGWKRTLEKLREKLNSPMPKRKAVRRPSPVDGNPWNLNDIYAYQFHEDASVKRGLAGKYIVLQKIGEGVPKYYDCLAMRLQVFDRIFDEVPTLEQLEGIRILPLDFPNRVTLQHDPIWMNGLFVLYKKSYYPKKYLTFIGNQAGPANNMINGRGMAWAHIDTLYEFYDMWQGIEYETLGSGIYHYLPKNTENKDK